LEAGPLEVEEETYSLLGGFQVVQTLGHVLGGEALYTFQFDDYGVFD
jgi:hypothetical protein